MKGPYAIWGCGRGYVQVGSAADRHEQRVTRQKDEWRAAIMKAARTLRWTARVHDRMGPSIREVGEALSRLAQAFRMGPPAPRFTNWRDDWSWM